MKQAKKQSLATMVLDTAKPGYPKPFSLSDNEQKNIAQFVELKITPLFQQHTGERAQFVVNMKDMTDAIKAYVQSVPGLASNELKAKAAKSLGQALAKDWITFIRNSELLKLSQVADEKISK